MIISNSRGGRKRYHFISAGAILPPTNMISEKVVIPTLQQRLYLTDDMTIHRRSQGKEQLQAGDLIHISTHKNSHSIPRTTPLTNIWHLYHTSSRTYATRASQPIPHHYLHPLLTHPPSRRIRPFLPHQTHGSADPASFVTTTEKMLHPRRRVCGP